MFRVCEWGREHGQRKIFCDGDVRDDNEEENIEVEKIKRVTQSGETKQEVQDEILEDLPVNSDGNEKDKESTSSEEEDIYEEEEKA